MKDKQQVFVIHGGSSFDSYQSYLHELRESALDYERLKPKEQWKQWLASSLSNADVLLPSFPNSQNAQYDEWKIVFEKMIPFFGTRVTLVGHSLGGMFLARYLHETPLQNPVDKIVLIAPGYDDDTNEELGSFKVLSAKGVEKSAREVHFFHSEDDPVVPFSELQKFRNDLPTAYVYTFTDRNHFLQPTFPELLEVIQGV